MPENDRTDDSQAGESESSSGSGLWNAIRSLFEENEGTSLREQIEEAIDEHEDENGEVCRKRRAHAGCRVGHTPSMFRDKCKDLPGTFGRGVPNLCPLGLPLHCDDGSCQPIDGECPEDY